MEPILILGLSRVEDAPLLAEIILLLLLTL